jgi:hypothetical protein
VTRIDHGLLGTWILIGAFCVGFWAALIVLVVRAA